ncbi:DNA gyrase inhibitor YacG [Aromatoleum anaerobium]|uniref:DNA gyrase inhibitor YacG n=1 Tax=Aromatoleum anaerobium TaxID=182180 RepID=A0ABX1PR88_9RHOO|nr:DNA gyrase inhibitor YacG [Aromatoleum anaerobium]MCK0509500.1 DNA gyrase inhibitor YacG [Aromatoleum anaerobium]
MAKVRIVSCPQCGAKVKWSADNPFRPFCSERCKQIDLGAWASENYRVPASTPPDNDDPPDPSRQD